MTPYQALWDYPLSVVMQMIHAQGVSNGREFDWVNAGDPSEEINEEFERLSQVSVEDLMQ